MKRSPLKRKPPKAKARKKKQTLPSLKTIKTQLWAECRRITWARAGGKCEFCNKHVVPDRIPGVCGDVHHMILRGASARLKFRPENLALVCGSCHYEFHNKDSQKGWKIFEQNRPEDYAYVEREKMIVRTIPAIEYRDLLVELRGWNVANPTS